MSDEDENLFNFGDEEEAIPETTDFPTHSKNIPETSPDAGLRVETEESAEVGLIPELAEASEEVSRLLQRSKELEKEMKNKDNILEQLSIACKLKAALERNEGKQPPPIGCEFSVQWLSSGSHLLLVELENRLDRTLVDWELLVQWNVLSGSNQNNCSGDCFSRCATVPALPPKAKFKLDLFSDKNLKLPICIKCFLMKTFRCKDPRLPNSSAEQEKTVILRLSSHFCTSWDLVQPKTGATWVPPRTFNAKTYSRGNCSTLKFSVSKLLAHLLCEGEGSPENVLRWLLPNSSGYLTNSIRFEESNDKRRRLEDTAICEDLAVGGSEDVSVKVTVTNEWEPISKILVIVEVTCGAKERRKADQWVSDFRFGIFAKFKIVMVDLTRCPDFVELDFTVLEEHLHKLESLKTLEQKEQYFFDHLFVDLPFT